MLPYIIDINKIIEINTFEIFLNEVVNKFCLICFIMI